MGSIIYDYLDETLFFDESLLDENFYSVQESELRSALDDYRDFILSREEQLKEEIYSLSDGIRIFGSKNYVCVESLKQTAFYLDQVIIPDKLFGLSRRETNFSRELKKFRGISQKEDNKINRQILTEVIKMMKKIAPMVEYDYVKFFPVSFYFEPDEEIPVYYSETQFSDVLPPELLSVYREASQVKSVVKRGDNLVIEEFKGIGRSIAVEFLNDEDTFFYDLYEQRVVEIDEDTKKLKFAISLPDEPPTQRRFETWVKQSINQSANSHYERLVKGVKLATKFNASYLTTSSFSHSLLSKEITSKGIQDHTAECVINMEVPFLRNISVRDLMSVRNNEGEAFEIFRREIESEFKELRTEEDPEVLRLKIENVRHELAEAKLRKLTTKIKELQKGALSQCVVAGGVLAGSVATTGLWVIASLVALAQGYSTYSEYRRNVLEHPSYFLWKLKK